MSMPMRVRINRPWGYLTMSLVAAMRHLRRRSLRHHEELILLQRWRDAVLLWLGRDVALGRLAADAGRVVKGYGRVRDKALDDLWMFIDQGLPLLEQLGAARNTKAGAISSGCAGRFIGVSLPNFETRSASLSAGLSGVQTGPGATALTRMPLSIRCVASERTKAWMPPLVIE